MDADLVRMISEEPANVTILLRGIERAVQRSYDEDLRRDGSGRVVATAGELKDRVNICINVARELRHEAKWSVQRIVDALPRILRRKLDGLDYDPTSEMARGSWAGLF